MAICWATRLPANSSWLIAVMIVLDAGGFRDFGPDVSIAAASIPPATGGTLTLIHGETASHGPYRIRLNSDGSAVVLRVREPKELDTGSWRRTLR